ncbi:RecB family exonuclease [Nocardia sp. CNY236]|uniref:RecB family exonuclease n=1 Tax=Nocardia sp. CNY236 TaxID=1169152 RepID=UPI000684C51C|nr:RecB family exonuclease [Nocardia sp. CNY236]
MRSTARTPPVDDRSGSEFRTTLTGGRPTLSPSRAMDFKQCPLKYRLRAIDRIAETPSLQAVRGTLVHAVLEDLFGLPAAERLPERADTLAASAWSRVRGERPEVVESLTDQRLEVFLDEARALVRRYYRLEDPTRFDPESCEARVEVELDDGVPLLGIIDRIDVAATGALRVVDYKTGRAPGPTRETQALFQLKFYALMVLRTRGRVPAQLRLIYLADAQILTYTPQEQELLRFERTLSALWAAIEEAGRSGDFQPNSTRLCSYCDYQPLCPEFGGTPPPYPGWPTGDPTARSTAATRLQ